MCSNNITQEKPLDYIQYFVLLIFKMMQEVDLLPVQVIFLTVVDFCIPAIK